MRCFIQLILIHIHGGGFVPIDDIDMGRIKGTMREAIDDGKNVIAARTMDGGRDAGRDDETRRMSDNETMEREENTRRGTRRERGMATMSVLI